MSKPNDLPPDPDGQNDDRAKWAENALALFAKETDADKDDGSQDISDLICDLMHACDRRREDFCQLLNWAEDNYIEECGRKPRQTISE